MFRNVITTTLIDIATLITATGIAAAHAVVYPRSVGADSFEKFPLRVPTVVILTRRGQEIRQVFTVPVATPAPLTRGGDRPIIRRSNGSRGLVGWGTRAPGVDLNGGYRRWTWLT